MPVSHHDIIIQLKAMGFEKLDNLAKGSRIVATEVRKMGNATGVVTRTFKKLDNGTMGLQTTISRTTQKFKRFRMEFLSFMFFGMYMQRVVQRVMMQSIKVFTEIAGSSNKAAQTIAVVGAQFKFLQFAIGSAIAEALEPFLPIIISIIDKLVDFIEQHPEDVFWGLAGAIVAFGTMSFVGQFALFVGSIGMLVQNLKGMSPAKLKALTGFLTKAAGLGAVVVGVKWFFDAVDEGDIFGALAGGFAVWGGMKIFTSGFKAGLPYIAIAIGFKLLSDPEAVARFIGQLTGTIAGSLVKLGRTIVLFLLEIITGVFTGEFDFAAVFEGFHTEMGTLRTSFDEAFTKASGMVNEHGDTMHNMVERHYVNDMGIAFQKLGLLNKSWEGVTGEVGISTTAVDVLIKTILAIPREIHTYHYIHSVNVGGGRERERGRGYQFGGYVPREGMYHLHGGELVVNPWGNVHIAGMSINVSAQTDANADDIANLVANKFRDEVERYRS